MIITDYIYNILRNNGSFIIVALITILFVSCHVAFNYKYIFSPIISNMPAETHKPLKIVVFDLDETLGCFVEIGMFWDALEKISKNPQVKLQPLNNKRFFELIDTFPEFLRPNITKILNYLLNKREINECDKIMIYTNNQGPKTWAKMISEYFENRLDKKIFDQIIAAFKVRGKVVEICRTSHDKSVDDLIKCTKIPSNAEICFLDDQYHPLMEQSNVYYINIKPYTFSMPYRDMAKRYYDKFKSVIDMVEKDFIDTIEIYMKKYNYTVIIKNDVEIDVDKVISKQIMVHLETFFKRSKKNHTIKKRYKVKNKKTRRNRKK